MKNYYEVLEVHENASQEIIEKAYKVLAKKYHPDIQPRDKIFWAETEFKKISEAYSILSDPEKRIIYDFENGFAGKEVTYEEKYNSLQFEQEKLKQELHSLKHGQTNTKPQNNTVKTPSPLGFSSLKSGIQGIAQGIYNETKASNEDRPKNLKALLLTVVIMAVLLFIFWNVPFIRNFLFPW